MKSSQNEFADLYVGIGCWARWLHHFKDGRWQPVFVTTVLAATSASTVRPAPGVAEDLEQLARAQRFALSIRMTQSVYDRHMPRRSARVGIPRAFSSAVIAAMLKPRARISQMIGLS